MAIFDRAIVGQILWFATVVVAAFGLCVGSFLNVVIWRLPLGMSLSHPGSHCPKCNHAIRPWENIPVLSWLLLRARCSQCGLPISVRYPLVEATNGLLWVALWWRLWRSGLPLTHGPAWFFLASLLLAVALIDLDHFLIPNRLTLAGGIVALALALAFPETYAIGHGGVHTIFSQCAVGWLGQAARQPHLLALARLAAGAAFGYGLLWVIRTLGRRLWGRVVTRPEAPAELRVADGALRVQGQEAVPLGQLLLHPEDRIAVEIVSGHLGRREGKGENWAEGLVLIGSKGVHHDGTDLPWEAIAELRVQAKSWAVPREVLGLGDLKLMAVLGAFLGPDAALFVAAFGALLGLLVGGGWVLATRQRRLAVPFGPFLAAAALVWLLAGPELLAAYSAWLLSGVHFVLGPSL